MEVASEVVILELHLTVLLEVIQGVIQLLIEDGENTSNHSPN